MHYMLFKHYLQLYLHYEHVDRPESYKCVLHGHFLLTVSNVLVISHV